VRSRLLPLLVSVAGVLSAPAAATAANGEVHFVCCNYNPAAVTINAGESVSWTPGAGITFDPIPGGLGHSLAPAAGQGEAFGRSGGAAPHSYRFATPGTPVPEPEVGCRSAPRRRGA